MCVLLPLVCCSKAAASSRGRGLIQSGARRLLGGSSSSGGGSSGALFSEPVINPRHPYFRLLRLYLEAYLPRPKAQGGRSTAGGGGAGPSGGGASATSAGGALGGLLGGGMGALSGLSANTAYAGEQRRRWGGSRRARVLLSFPVNTAHGACILPLSCMLSAFLQLPCLSHQARCCCQCCWSFG